MAPSVLGVGITAKSPAVPDHLREGLQKALDEMDRQMVASPFEWEMLYLEPEMDYGLLKQKLHERQWDLVMVGAGLRTAPPLLSFFERIVNTVHETLPKTKFAFNASPVTTEEACRRIFKV